MIYWHYLKLNLKAVLEYRLSSWFLILAQSLTTLFYFIGLRLLFLRFDSLAGWTFAEAALCYGVTGAAFALAECFARGFDLFSRLVIQGSFDRILLRPRSTILQVMGANTEISRLGRFLMSMGILLSILPMTGISWESPKIITLCFMILGGSAVFTGVFILGATFCFFTLEGLEVINIFTDGGRELASYPLPIYGRWISRFFTFVIPYGTMNYLPLLYLTGRVSQWPLLYMLMPLLGFLFLLPCVGVWRIGVRHYNSSGS
ncbi:MAG: ABC-2 family transporter protein [Treponema sp.]|nr:ABC-2 family transporter protein [Treponema sp.]